MQTHRDMVDHVFLHRKLEANPENLHRTELKLLHILSTHTQSFKTAIFPQTVQRLFSNMKQLHCVEALDPEVISNQIGSLKNGDMFGMYIREQNCGLFIQMVEDDVATLSTFQASLPNEMIHGDNINGDIQVVAFGVLCEMCLFDSILIPQVDYPTRSIKVKLSTILKSEEFAKQIIFLDCTSRNRAMSKAKKVGHEFDEVRNVPHPMYVSQWLMAVASNRSTEVNTECHLISKKMRDEVIKGEHKLPFRRSGFYITMKVFLQLGLTIELGDERGKFLYKLVMLSFMLPLYHAKTIDDDIAIQMMAKIARRTDKTESYAASADYLENDIISLKNDIIVSGRETIRSIRERLNRKFEAIQVYEMKKSDIKALPKLQFEQDKTHQIPRTLKYTKLRKSDTVSEAVPDSTKVRKILRHHDKTLPDIDKIHGLSYGASEIDVLLFLADIEHWILDVLDESISELDAHYLRRLATTYMSKAQTFYKNDCFGYSRMVLTMLKIIQVILTNHTFYCIQFNIQIYSFFKSNIGDS